MAVPIDVMDVTETSIFGREQRQLANTKATRSA
jgi:hypothetical protein